MFHRQPTAKLKSVKATIKTPLIDVEGTWEADENEQRAAWELYVELITRISTQELHVDDGLLREALSSLYSIFRETREILKRYGPSIAQPKGRGNLSFGYLAVCVLNSAIRPILAYWHPVLLAYENTRRPDISPPNHERAWARNVELREKLNELRNTLKEYAFLLAQVAGVPSLNIKR